MLDSSWTEVRRFMERTCGVVMRDDQYYLLEARLAPVAKQLSFPSIAAYVTAAIAPPMDGARPATRALIEAMTTHETLFFRDAAFWRYLEDIVIPRAARGRAGRPIRVWSAAASTGQEAYSMAMLLEERFPELAARAQIVASDVSAISVERGREGVYSVLEVNRGLGAQRMVRHFDRDGGGFRIKKALRDRVQWQTHNLLSLASPPPDCDIVLCRNVLIYFNERDRDAVSKKLHDALTPGGVIGLGTAESLKAPLEAPGWYAPKSMPAPQTMSRSA